MFKRLLAALLPPADPGGRSRDRRGAVRRQPSKTPDQIRAELEAELEAEAATADPDALRRERIRQRIQEGDAETLAALVRAWIAEDRK